ncbi:uncharacterized protein LOC134302734 [Trichomycterus rosablanca]|uniref:uncharacterized protein LOC134302734 n=1 Tax=Trichomycterus rosablanca TaxID=2290929 RepID=UPI002F359880
MATVKQIIIFSFLLSVKASSDVYKLVNSEVQLDTQDKNVQFDQFRWMFKSDNILRYDSESGFIKKYETYKDRVEFNTETQRLTLKNLQKTIYRSGPYIAKAESNQDNIVARYTLYVLDPVKKPELTYQRSSDSCNVTCLGLTLSINFDKKICEESETLTENVSYTLSLCVNGNQVICNHSNPASSKVTSKEINQLCPREPKSKSEAITTTGSVCLLKICILWVWFSWCLQ